MTKMKEMTRNGGWQDLNWEYCNYMYKNILIQCSIIVIILLIDLHLCNRPIIAKTNIFNCRKGRHKA